MCTLRWLCLRNISPESFYKGSIVIGDPVNRILEFEDLIDFVDVGAMSTAPYLDAWIPVEKELERVKRFLPGILLEVLGSLLILIP